MIMVERTELAMCKHREKALPYENIAVKLYIDDRGTI
ncbi:hypothetical protein JOC83_002861 [Bacillus iocasae]|uniref:Uncharacterized protein n=1 Tax=Priestia iocasae TaxID=2291674 RepID=A0ABS2QZ65_9BACI|nr:hypothetical protein [Metabacillus iocasae]